MAFNVRMPPEAAGANVAFNVISASRVAPPMAAPTAGFVPE
jgi:hypothetical protein